MKQTTYIYILITLILLTTGCDRKKKDGQSLKELIQAEELMFDHPDRALQILQNMPMPSPAQSKENHALWCLLTTQAQYKQLMKIPSDSLIRIAYDYYKPTQNARRKAMAALYMGGVNYNLGKIEEAIQFYMEARTEMEKTEDYQLGYLIMSGLGNIYLYRHLTEYALEACTQAYNYAVKDSNKRYQMTSLKYLARCYCLLGDLPKAIKIYEQCSQMALEFGSKEKDYFHSILQEMALVYSNSREYKKSLDIALTLPPSPQLYSLIGKNFTFLGELDSAHYYLTRGLNTDNIYTSKSIYQSLYKLTDHPKYQNYMKQYCDSLLFYSDSITKLDKGKELIAYKEKYDNEKLLYEKQKLELEKANITLGWFITILIGLIFIFILIAIYFRKRIAIHQKEEELTRLSLQLHEKELEADKNETYIIELQQQYQKENNKTELLEEQTEMLNKVKKENEQLNREKQLLHEKIASYSISSQEVTRIKTLSDQLQQLEKREKDLCNQLLIQNPFLHQLHFKPAYLNDAELREICTTADQIFQQFTQRLAQDIPALSEHEITLCSLIKLRFSISEISAFLNITSASVSRSKLRIKNKICSELGKEIKEKNLDIWIWEY